MKTYLLNATGKHTVSSCVHTNLESALKDKTCRESLGQVVVITERK